MKIESLRILVTSAKPGFSFLRNDLGLLYVDDADVRIKSFSLGKLRQNREHCECVGCHQRFPQGILENASAPQRSVRCSYCEERRLWTLRK